MIRKLLATFAVAGIAAAAAVAPAGAATYTLNVGTALTQDDPGARQIFDFLKIGRDVAGCLPAYDADSKEKPSCPPLRSTKR